MVREKQEIHKDEIVIESVIFETKLIPLSLTKDNACHCEDRNKRYRRSNVIRNTRCVLIDVTLDVYRLIKQVTKHSTLRGDHTPCLYECESHHGLNRGRNLEIGNDTINCRKRRKKKKKEKLYNKRRIEKCDKTRTVKNTVENSFSIYFHGNVTTHK